MGSLKDFLAEQAKRLPAQESESARKRDEWIAAVERLNERIKGWLRQADEDNLLNVQDRSFQIREEGIGNYAVNGLVISLGINTVRFEPVARNVAGPLLATGAIHVARAFGRVDMTNGLNKYMIFRVETSPKDQWTIVEEDGLRLRRFDRASFEAALQSLFG